MKKFLLVSSLCFYLAVLYLHQRVQIYIEAYNLSRNYKLCKELIDKRDALLYNFYCKVPLERVNQWVESNEFKLVEKERIFAFKVSNKGEKTRESRMRNFRLSFNRLLRPSYASPENKEEDRTIKNLSP